MICLFVNNPIAKSTTIKQCMNGSLGAGGRTRELPKLNVNGLIKHVNSLIFFDDRNARTQKMIATNKHYRLIYLKKVNC